MSSTIGPELPAVHSRRRGRSSAPHNRLSTRVSVGRSEVSTGRSPTRSISSVSIPLGKVEVDVVRIKGLKHAKGTLEARHYKTEIFASHLLEIIHALQVPSWLTEDIKPDALRVSKVSGSLTNAVFFVSSPSNPLTAVLLLRIYGPSSGSLISRPKELQILHILSSQYHIGPRVYGTFENGRIEEYFQSTALVAKDLRDPEISSWIGARMAELHQVDIATVMQSSPSAQCGESEFEWEAGARRNVKSWLVAARQVLALPSVSDSIRSDLDLDTFEVEWGEYMRWIDEQEQHGASRRVFAHNDTQYGNLLRLTKPKAGTVNHQQIIVVDFEYASPNPAAFDIANHFHEWTANYHSDNPHILNPSLYPTLDQRQNFYRAYTEHSKSSDLTRVSIPAPSEEKKESLSMQLETLDRQVRMWSPASHGMWAVWGIVQAREVLEGKDGEPEFDYVGYSQCRMASFRRELRALVTIS